MSDTNENKEIITQGQEASIDVTIDDTIEEEKEMVEASEGDEDSTVDKEKTETDVVAEDSDENASEETTEELKEEPEEKPEEEQKETVEESETVETEEPETLEEVDQPKEEQELDEVAKMRAEIEELQAEKEAAANAKELQSAYADAEQKRQVMLNNLQQAVIKTLEENGIDASKTLDELKSDKAKYNIARGIIKEAQQVKEVVERKIAEAVAEKERKVVFKAAEREFKKYKLTDEQQTAAAETFVRICINTGMNDLDEDLKAKVKLAVAQAKMDKPEELKVEEPKEKVEEKTDTTLSETPSEKIEVGEKPEVEAKEEVPPTEPDLSDFKESATGNAVNAPASVTVDNVLQKLASLPFKERTEFLLENQDIYNEAMRIRRAQA